MPHHSPHIQVCLSHKPHPSRETSLPFFTITLIHNEGKPAQLKLEAPWTTKQAQPPSFPFSDTYDVNFSYISVWYHKKNCTENKTSSPNLLFFGHQRNQKIDKDLMQWLFEAKQDNEKDLLETMLKEQHPQLYRPLWDVSLDDVLLTNPYTIYWNRCTGHIGLSHLTKGQTWWTIDHQNDPDKMHSISMMSVSKVNVNITFDWVQHVLTFRDVAKEVLEQWNLQGLGSEDSMGTLTHKSLEHGWPEAGKILGPGCYVAQSTLTKRQDAGLPTWVNIPLKDNSNVVSARCYWYDAVLVMGLTQRYGRQEVVRYALENATNKNCKDKGSEIAIHVHLPSNWARHDQIPVWHPLESYAKDDKVQHEGRVYRYCPHETEDQTINTTSFPLRRFKEDASSSSDGWILDAQETTLVLPMFSDSMMDQDMGKALLNHSLQQAKVAMLKGTRCCITTLRGTIEDWHQISLDDGIQWTSNQSAVTVNAKVVGFELMFDARTRYGYVQLTAAHGPDTPSHIEHAVGWSSKWEDFSFSHMTPSQDPPPIPQSPPARIHVTNTLGEQIKAIAQHDSTGALGSKAIKSKETSIRIKFSSPTASDKLTRSIELTSENLFNPHLF